MLSLLLIYILIGALFAVAFAAVGYRVIDQGAAGAGWIVRLIWMPAALALWPLLAVKWVKAGKGNSKPSMGSNSEKSAS